jgi:hypothetical protein
LNRFWKCRDSENEEIYKMKIFSKLRYSKMLFFKKCSFSKMQFCGKTTSLSLMHNPKGAT